MCVCVYVYIYIYIYMCVCMYIYIYIYIYMCMYGLALKRGGDALLALDVFQTGLQVTLFHAYRRQVNSTTFKSKLRRHTDYEAPANGIGGFWLLVYGVGG